MKPFEIAYLSLRPVLPPLGRIVHRRLLAEVRARPGRPRVLDVGGRKSHVTIGVPADVVVTDLPRRTELQRRLNLGVDDEILRRTLGRRSNLTAVVYDDMTRSAIRDGAFDCVVAMEVLEHVEEDARFLDEVARVLAPGGTFLMSTPNGDAVENTNPDHVRHYTRDELVELLAARFAPAEVEYAVRQSPWRRRGLRAWSPRRPLRTAASMLGNAINWVESSPADLRERADVTRHLVARAEKPA